MNIRWSKVSLFFFLVVALIGTALRGSFLFSTPFNYAHLVHAHSHVAFQGWIYTILFLLLTRLYLTKEQIKQGRYPLQFKSSIPVIIGVLISFTLQGYAFYSILFSTLFQCLNYWFIYRFLNDVRAGNPASDQVISIRFVKTGLWLGLLSTIVPFVVGALSAKGLSGSEAYNSLIYTFLHLQYNGWFLFVAIGLFFKVMEDDLMSYHFGHAKRFYGLFVWAVIPAISLSLLGMSYSNYVELPAYLSAVCQLVGAIFFYLSIQKYIGPWLRNTNRWVQLMIVVFLIGFGLKILLQSLSVIPYFSGYAFHNKYVMLAYLHLSLIGVISMLLLSLLIKLNWIRLTMIGKSGLMLLLAGFASTELVLALGGIDLFYSHGLMFAGSAAMATGILLLLINRTAAIIPA